MVVCVVLQIHAIANRVGSIHNVEPLYVVKPARMVETAQHQTPVHVHMSGKVLIAELLYVIRSV